MLRFGLIASSWYRLGFLLLTAPIWLGAGFAAEISDSKAVEKSFTVRDQDWRSTKRCGPNALYLFLKSRGWEGQLSQLYESIPISENGCSLFQLEQAANLLGVRTAAMRANIEGLRSARIPFITHHDNEWSSGGAVGHFFLVTDVGRIGIDGLERVDVIDPITLVTKEIPIVEFCRSWTGYMLIDMPEANSNATRISTVGIVFVIVSAGVWFFGKAATPLKRSRIGPK